MTGRWVNRWQEGGLRDDMSGSELIEDSKADR